MRRGRPRTAALRQKSFSCIRLASFCPTSGRHWLAKARYPRVIRTDQQSPLRANRSDRWLGLSFQSWYDLRASLFMLSGNSRKASQKLGVVEDVIERFDVPCFYVL